ncbi:class I SAM-dependent methyltransferase [Patescibacteria group bacterium]|nr:class I SAM-dependent methyltransferase [Patescibacteria group bacterium]MBU4017159.1 class I SAM-dependent methyltransferase [Patescibacteria group bacterium]MBU4098893.1 class I SAM-dependent methyltransferase [Patescibacteria group bacterium]
MKGINSKIYNKEYYLNHCLGFEEFKKYKGKKVHPRIVKFLSILKIVKGINILDVGCGRGDLSIECARKGAKVIGIDYSKDGINIANSSLKKQEVAIQRNVSFFRMDAKKLKFKDNYFDIVTSIDVFEHLYKDELEKTMHEISRVLKSGGMLLVHTETNKIYLNFTHRIWSYPLDQALIKINGLFNKKNYPGMPKDPRNALHKIQHVNEPTYFYLKSLFQRHRFSGKIFPIVPMKPSLSWKDRLYNVFVSLFPISGSFPFHLFFAHDFICVMKNNKD